ncbi:MAG: M42 family peptidase [Anaerolineae bacterium]|nr:M42 family peptidase [Anaerolineae bacterium]
MQWDSLADEVHTDAMGNLIALQRGQGTAPRPSVMVAAHIDEIGLIVTGIEGEFLRIHAIGGIDRRVLLGLEVIVHGQRPLPGIIGARPPHVLPPEERDKILPWKQIFVDVGLPAEEVKTLVRVGDHVTLERDLVELQEGLIAGKALDNRASVAAVTIALELLTHRQHTWDFYAVATVQEEVGTKGAITSAYNLIPQLAVALDVTFATQHNDSQTGTFELDKGPTIGIGPNFHPQVVARLKNTAETEEIPYQLEPVPGHSGTDAWSIQVARAGIPTGLLSIPVRYMHQPVETAALRDIERTGRWLASFIAGLEEDFCPRWEDDDVEDNTDMEGD